MDEIKPNQTKARIFMGAAILSNIRLHSNFVKIIIIVAYTHISHSLLNKIPQIKFYIFYIFIDTNKPKYIVVELFSIQNTKLKNVR